MTQDLLEILKDISNNIKLSIEDIKYDSKNFQHILVVSLYGTIIEGVDSCITLYENSQYISIPVISRNILEAFVDLKNITMKTDYQNYMLLSYHEQRKKLFKNIIHDIINKSKKSKLDFKELKSQYCDAIIESEFLESKGFKSISIYNKFKMANLEEIYRSLYSILCQETHNNLSVLENRHIEKSKSSFKIVIFKKYTDIEKITLLHYIQSILTLSFREIQKFFKLKDTEYTREVADLFFKYEEQEIKLAKTS